MDVIPGTFVPLLIEFLEASNTDPSATLGISRNELAELNLEISIQQWQSMLKRSSLLLSEPEIGLILGSRVKTKHIGIVGYLSMAAETLEQALELFKKYSPLIYMATPLQIREQAKYIDLVWGKNGYMAGPLVDEFFIATLVKTIRNLTDNEELSPIKIQFINPEPENINTYEDFFGCPVLFDREETIVRADKKILSEPIKSYDGNILRILERAGNDQLKSRKKTLPTIVKLREIISKNIGERNLDIDMIARKMNVTARTLQRKLKSEGTTFRSQVNDIRETLSKQYLSETDIEITEIALLLGYSEHSAFSRSFTRWTGLSPVEYRTLQKQTS